MKKIGLPAAVTLLMACGVSQTQEKQSMQSGVSAESRTRASLEGRLESRPKPPQERGPKGLHKLSLGGERDGWIYVPESYRADRPAPLLLLLHGAGGEGRGLLNGFRKVADEAGLILLAPDSRGKTWDVIRGGYGPDVGFIDHALTWTFDRYAVDLSRLAASGFSDGASYALSIGVMNGDLFSHVIAFSPGFMAPESQKGRPRIFVSHGTRDQVLPIERCSRQLVPRLQSAGYDVLYREFDGPHTFPPDIVRQALDWFAALQKKS